MNNSQLIGKVIVHASAIVAPTAVIQGKCVIGARANVGPFVVLSAVADCDNPSTITIGDDVVVAAGTVVEARGGSILIGTGATVGPHSYIDTVGGDIEFAANARTDYGLRVQCTGGRVFIGASSIGAWSVLRSAGGQIELAADSHIGDHVRLDAEGGRIVIGERAKIDAGNEILGKGGVVVGPRSHLWSGSYVSAFQEPISFEYQVTLGQKCVVAGRGSIVVKARTMIGGMTYVVSETHKFNHPFLPIREQSHTARGILIGSEAWIASGCTILDGVTIGTRAMVAARSLVTSSIPAYKFALGTPARIKTDRRQALAEALLVLTGYHDSIDELAGMAQMETTQLIEWLHRASPEDLALVESYLSDVYGPASDVVERLRGNIDNYRQINS